MCERVYLMSTWTRPRLRSRGGRLSSEGGGGGRGREERERRRGGAAEGSRANILALGRQTADAGRRGSTPTHPRKIEASAADASRPPYPAPRLPETHARVPHRAPRAPPPASLSASGRMPGSPQPSPVTNYVARGREPLPLLRGDGPVPYPSCPRPGVHPPCEPPSDRAPPAARYARTACIPPPRGRASPSQPGPSH